MEDVNWRNRRRNYFIKKKFQRNFILKFCALVAAGALISGYIIYSMSKATVTTTFVNSRLQMKSTAEYILPAVLLSSAVVIVVVGLATIAVTLFTSHRIAGPLYRMEKDVEEIIAGNLTIRFHLRKADEIKALAQTLDRMSDSLRARIAAVKNASSELESAIGSCCKDASRPELKEKAEKLKKALSEFRV